MSTLMLEPNDPDNKEINKIFEAILGLGVALFLIWLFFF